MAEVKKKEILLTLNDTQKTAQICKALSSETRLDILKCLTENSMTISELAEHFLLPMSSMCLHVKTLKEAGLISVIPKPGPRSPQKLCGIKVSTVTLNLFADQNTKMTKQPFYFYMPIGLYSNCKVSPPCGIASASSYLSFEDSPLGFYSPERAKASLLWFTKGFLDYQFPNNSLLQKEHCKIEFSFEICAEAPGYNNNWPSDITVELNHKPVAVFYIAGDYGGRKGIYNPDWWSSSNSQFGEYKKLLITDQGCYVNGKKTSDETIESLKLKEDDFFYFTLKVDENSEHVGGLNLFGKHFGDYAQDIIMKVEYE